MALILDRACFAPNESVTGTTPGRGWIVASRLGKNVIEVACDEHFDLGPMPEGGYSIFWRNAEGHSQSSAFEVLADPWGRLRYGFVSDFSDAIDVSAHAEWVKRLHLTAVQFYDWAWSHEFLVGPDETYGDPLGAQVSIEVVRELIRSYTDSGAVSCGYAAVYAVNKDGWSRWSDIGLRRTDGTPHQLGEDFLWIVDPADPRWLDHFITELRKANELGFPAFHLDQYGWPKLASRLDGKAVNLAEAFPIMLNKIIAEIPECRFIFNNVNDFPTWSTSQALQHATYIEVWEPHETYGDLANLVRQARAANPDRPIVLSAYLNQFAQIQDIDQEIAANAALSLAIASIASGGAAHLITGGEGRVLHHPYYVTNHLAVPSTREALIAAFDFIVAAGDLLYDTTRSEVTKISAFGINEEIRFAGPFEFSPDARPGTVWARVFQTATGLTIHFINLVDQTDDIWDAPKSPIVANGDVQVSIEAAGLAPGAVIGAAQTGSVIQEIGTPLVGTRFEFSVKLTGAWTIAHVSFRGR